MRAIKTIVSGILEPANSDPLPSLGEEGLLWLLPRPPCAWFQPGLRYSQEPCIHAQAYAGALVLASLDSSTLRGEEKKPHFHPKCPELFDLILLAMKPMLHFTAVVLPVYLTKPRRGRGGTGHLGMAALNPTIRPPATLQFQVKSLYPQGLKELGWWWPCTPLWA